MKKVIQGLLAIVLLFGNFMTINVNAEEMDNKIVEIEDDQVTRGAIREIDLYFAVETGETYPCYPYINIYGTYEVVGGVATNINLWYTAYGCSVNSFWTYSEGNQVRVHVTFGTLYPARDYLV